MMRDSSSVRLIWSLGRGPSTGGSGGLPPGFFPLASACACRAASSLRKQTPEPYPQSDLVFANARLGRDAEAKAALANFLRLKPGSTPRNTAMRGRCSATTQSSLSKSRAWPKGCARPDCQGRMLKSLIAVRPQAADNPSTARNKKSAGDVHGKKGRPPQACGYYRRRCRRLQPVDERR